EVDKENQEPLELPKINSNILKMIIEWCKHHQNDSIENLMATKSYPSNQPNISTWDENFLRVEQITLMELILASDYLIIEPLKEMCCRVVASWIPGKSPEQLRKLFNIENDFTIEEEQQLQKENAWCE
ncbi:MAG: hypothetical protein MHPSP_003393, partial [Paramarteilia canceri]